MTQPENTQLHQFIIDHFDLEELKTLCFNLGIEYDDLGGGGRADKVRELVLYMKRHGRLVDLRAVLVQQRATAYRTAFGETVAQPVVTTTPSPRRDRRRIERNPRQVFVSHATADAEFAHRLAADLQRTGFPVWIAPESIPSGQWVSAINRGLAESGIMLLVLSPAAMESPWVEMETNVAIELERAGEMRFIPVCLVKERYDPVWHAYQWVMFDRDYRAGWQELSRRLDGDSTPSPPQLDHRIHEKTGIELIRIPAGPFLYGSSDADTMARDNEKPQRTIELPEYWIGRYPVTNAQYKSFIDATGHITTAEREGYSWIWTGSKLDKIEGADWHHPRGPKSSINGKDDHPVVQVSWHDAKAFCDWAGLALPSEEQWEKAARGTDGRIWPWGDEPPMDKHCNFNRNVGGTTSVGKYSPKGESPYGCADMAGNVWDWTGAWYTEGSTRALRGGSWDSSDLSSRAAYRNYNIPDDWNNYIGFRVVELLSDPDS